VIWARDSAEMAAFLLDLAKRKGAAWW